ncbi:lipocalin family protein [Thalassobellus citreus]|uniref:lipocalin family protein n=1 Tax=Thalassobellus citreus TaxID=3367752 RepID=UPI0037B20C71
MKKITILFIAVSISLFSCSSEDSSPVTSGNILGTWTGNSIDYSGTTITNFQGQTIETDYVGESYDMDYTLTFNEDPNVLISEGNYSLKLTSTILGQTTVQNVENIEFLEAGTWSLKGDVLTTSAGGKSYEYSIIELTESTLKISVSTEEDLSQQGATITATVDAVMTFVK